MSNKRQADLSSFFLPNNNKATRSNISLAGSVKSDPIHIDKEVADEIDLTKEDGNDVVTDTRSNEVIPVSKPITKLFTFGTRPGNSSSSNTQQQAGFSIQEDTLLKYVYVKKSEEQPIIGETLPVAAFDLDSTLIFTKNGNTFPVNGDDWRWSSKEIAIQLKQLYKGTHKCKPTTHCLVIISNQGGVVAKDTYKRYGYLKQRLENITKELDLPIRVYAATKPAPIKTSGNKSKAKTKDNDAKEKVPNKFRKPETGMWDAMVQDLAELGITVDMEQSFYVGDAAGRPNDFSDSDLKFAQKVGVTFFTPEEFFETMLK